MPTPERAQWAVDRLQLSPGTRVLEVGCGQGHAAALVCEVVGDTGSLTAVDRSTLMMDVAGGRLGPWAEAGRLTMLCGALEEVEVAEGGFDVVFGFSVAPMWRHPEVTAAAWRALRPGGTLHLFDQPPAWKHAADVDAWASPVIAVLQGYGFETYPAEASQLSTGWAVHVRASRPVDEQMPAAG